MRRRWVRKGTEEIGRGEDMMKYRKVPRARSHPLLAPVPYHTSSTLAFYQSKLNGNRRREGKGK